MGVREDTGNEYEQEGGESGGCHGNIQAEDLPTFQEHKSPKAQGQQGVTVTLSWTRIRGLDEKKLSELPLLSADLLTHRPPCEDTTKLPGPRRCRRDSSRATTESQVAIFVGVDNPRISWQPALPQLNNVVSCYFARLTELAFLAQDSLIPAPLRKSDQAVLLGPTPRVSRPGARPRA